MDLDILAPLARQEDEQTPGVVAGKNEQLLIAILERFPVNRIGARTWPEKAIKKAHRMMGFDASCLFGWISPGRAILHDPFGRQFAP